MEIEYRSTKRFRPEQLQDLFASVNWSSAQYPDRLQKSVAGSETVFSAWHNGSLVGLINAMSDGSMTAYCHYLLVRPEYQKRRIGARLLRMLKDEYHDFLKIVLVCDAPEVGFYEKAGFFESRNSRVMYLTEMKD